MGIRYYAYAFGAELTAQAIADPFTILSSDPLADAWGLEPGAAVSVTLFGQTVPERDMLYLDKAWRALQALTEPGPAGRPARPSFRLFEGTVGVGRHGWNPWIRTLHPDEFPAFRATCRRSGTQRHSPTSARPPATTTTATRRQPGCSATCTVHRPSCPGSQPKDVVRSTRSVDSAPG